MTVIEGKICSSCASSSLAVIHEAALHRSVHVIAADIVANIASLYASGHVYHCLFVDMQVQGMVDSYKGANLDIGNIGKGISELLLVHIDPHRVYENLEFEEDQVFNFPPST